MMKLKPQHSIAELITYTIGGICSVTISFLVSALLINFAAVNRKNEPAIPSSGNVVIPATTRIALFLGADLASLRAQTKGMTDMLTSQDISLTTKIYYHQGNPILLQKQMEDAIESKPDAILTVGTLASQVATQTLSKRGSRIPLLFSNVMGPVECGISKTETLTGYNSTGIAEDYTQNLENYIRAMLTVRPDAKRVKIIFNAGTPVLEQQADSLQSALGEKEIACDFIPVYQYNDIAERARMMITGDVDMVVILREYLTNRAVPLLAKICESVGATLFASDAYSVEKGAAAAHCMDEYETGIIIARHLLKVLKNQGDARNIPITFLNASKLCSLHINPFRMDQQHVQPSLIDLLSEKKVVITHQ